jgi:probable phosphoglycerate mutase
MPDFAMTRLLLIRHGHVDGIQPERFRGRTDLRLTPEGLRQVAATARRIASRWQPVRVYSSPLERCLQTGQEIAKTCRIELSVLEDLNDLDYGEWRWRLHSEVRAQWRELFDRWRSAPHWVRFPGGESLQDLIARTANVVRLAIERHPNETVVVVGHESGIRAMLLQLLDQPLSAYWRLAQDPCAVNEVNLFGHGARVLRLNQTDHLAKCRTGCQ